MRKWCRPWLGVTLVELALVVAILALLGVVAAPLYREHLREQATGTGRTDIKQLEVRIERFFTENRRFPADLVELGTSPLDPWGRPYEYLNIDAGGPGVAGKQRKDQNLVPINSDYDLYSRGPDGATLPPLTSRPSQDDIVRAANGAWVGVAEEY